jgi:hypothetical protein
MNVDKEHPFDKGQLKHSVLRFLEPMLPPAKRLKG